jgi:FOG: WD40 repeat
MIGTPLIPCVCEWIATATRAGFLSLATVVVLSGAVGGIGVLIDPEDLWQDDYMSIKDCVPLDGGRQAISLYWIQPAIGSAGRSEVAVHSLDGLRSAAYPSWTHVWPRCMTCLSSRDQLFLGARDGAIYGARLSQPGDIARLLFRHPEIEAFCLQCANDGRTLLSLGPQKLCAWNLESQALAWQQTGVECFAIHPNCQTVLCGMRDGYCVELDLRSGIFQRDLNHPGWPILKIDFSREGTRLVCAGYGGQIIVADWQSGERLWENERFPRHSAASRVASFSPSGDLLVTPYHEDSRRLVIWKAATGERLGELRGHTKAVTGITFTGEQRLVSWSTDGTIRTWDLAQQKAIAVVSLSVPGPMQRGGSETPRQPPVEKLSGGPVATIQSPW